MSLKLSHSSLFRFLKLRFRDLFEAGQENSIGNGLCLNEVRMILTAVHVEAHHQMVFSLPTVLRSLEEISFTLQREHLIGLGRN